MATSNGPHSARRALSALLIAAFTGTCALAVTPPNTGQFSADGRDKSYTIVGDTTGQISTTGADIIVPAFLVPTTLQPAPPNNWPSPGAASIVRWIGPAADQTTAKRQGCCKESWTAYEVGFRVENPADVNFTATILAKDYTDVFLNGVKIFSGAASQVSNPKVLTITPSTIPPPRQVKGR